MSRLRTILGTAGLALAAAACSEQPVLGPGAPGTAGGTETVLASVKCVAQVQAGTLTCDAPVKMRADGGGFITVGGQGIYVLLASSGTSYNSGTSVFQTNVTVQNLSAQPLGTTDGNFADGRGIRVFFYTLPAVTSGSGTVTVANADSTVAVNLPSQPAFVYSGILAPGATSTSKNWQFTVPSTVTTFSFQVEISAEVPMSDGILRWQQSGASIRGLSCASTTYCLAVGDAGVIRVWNGTSWGFSASGTTNGLNAVSAVSSTSAIAVGSGGVALQWNGTTWKSLTTGTASSLRGVWCASATSCFAVGDAGLFMNWNGTSWSALTTEPYSDTLYAVWGTSATDIYVAGQKGALIHWNGSGWTDTGISSDRTLRGIWGSSATDVYVVGDADTTNGMPNGAIWHGSGTTTSNWSKQSTLPVTVNLQAVGGTGSTNVFAVGPAGVVLQNTSGGTSWTNITSTVVAGASLTSVAGSGTDVFLGGLGGTLKSSTNSGVNWTGTSGSTGGNNLNWVWGSASNDVYAVGDAGTILHWNGSSLGAVTSGTTANLYGVFGTTATDLYAVGSGGTILHSANGTTWTAMTSGTTDSLFSVWGTSSTDVWAVGQAATVLHYNGTTWSPVVVDSAKDGTGAPLDLGGVWGTASNNVFIVGDSGRRLNWNGTTWTSAAYDVTDSTGGYAKRYFHSVWGTSATDVWAVATHGVIFHLDGTGIWKDIPTAGSDTTLLHAVFGSGPGDVYAVGDSGHVFHQDNSDLSTGGHWSFMGSGVGSITLRGVWAPSLTESFVVGDGGIFLHGIQ
ncbi:MAG TPA: hypothetical protein VMG41_13470 [Gemmatimonadales bacterium]|nr:hypothetical protein [Gemmatimonadales bacterium]